VGRRALEAEETLAAEEALEAEETLAAEAALADLAPEDALEAALEEAEAAGIPSHSPPTPDLLQRSAAKHRAAWELRVAAKLLLDA
jgi:hypothetical protein